MLWQRLNGEKFDEEKTLQKAQEGNREAFAMLIELHRLAVIDVVYRFCGDAFLAEDAAQEAFIRCWQHLKQYQPTASFRSWLYRIAINAARDLLRHEKPRVDFERIEVSSEHRLEQQVENNQRANLIQHAVLQLPEASRIVLVLREFAGMSYQEISDSLDIPLGTVMSRLSYARKCLVKIVLPLQEEL